MTCTPIKLDNGATGFVCPRGKRPIRCTQCGKPGDLLCDWKVKGKASGTCDAPICERCTMSPAPDKDLCPDHAKAFDKWKESQ